MPNPFAHIELNTDDVAQAASFYKALFNWKLSPMGPDYTMIDVGNGTGGGMQKKPMAEAPAMWLPYVQVDDVRATVAKARELGAAIHVDYMDIGEMGAIGVFSDLGGAAIGVWAMAKKAAPKKAAAKKPAAKSAATKKAVAKKAAPKKPVAKKASSTPKKPGQKAKRQAKR